MASLQNLLQQLETSKRLRAKYAALLGQEARDAVDFVNEHIELLQQEIDRKEEAGEP